MLINQEIKKYKLLSEDREKILIELDEINNKNNELALQNELLQNKINLMKKQQDELNNKILNLTKDNNKYISQIKELTKKLENSESNKPDVNLNFNDTDKLATQISEISENNIKKLNDGISPIKLSFINLEKNVDELINNKVLSFINNKVKTLDDMMKEKNDKNVNNYHLLFEENKKLIEELNEQKSKIISNNDKNKFDDLKNKNIVLEERIKNLLEEKKVNHELYETKNKELEKTKTKIKDLNDKIYDINAYINSNCKSEAFKKKLCTICQLDDFK